MRNNLFENETRPVFHRAGQNRPELHKSSSPNVTSCLTSLSHARRKKKCVGNARQGNLDWLSIQMPTCLDAFLLCGIVETFSGFGEKGILEHQLGEKKKILFHHRNSKRCTKVRDALCKCRNKGNIYFQHTRHSFRKTALF